MIVYRVNDTTEQPTPFDCQPFRDTLNPANGSPILISQKKDDTLTLPQGVAYTLDANQMIRLEMHYINATTKDVTLQSSSTMIPVGDIDINIPPQSDATLGPVFFKVPSQFASVNFFAITGHEHQWGTNVQVWTATNATDKGAPVYQVPDWSWSEPKTVVDDPPFTVPAKGGFKFQCDWFNASSSNVTFGESATQEMCFFWAYYYPKQPGAQVCFHTDKVPGGADGCCPGSAVCQFLP
jgi:hypothetical protein